MDILPSYGERWVPYPVPPTSPLKQQELHLKSHPKEPQEPLIRMQAAAAAVCLAGPLPFKGTKSLVTRRSSPRPCRTVLSPRAMASSTPETPAVDYSSSASVFPAEACETIGGDACDVEMFPEVKPSAPASNTRARAGSEEVEREYVEYNEPKTVFPGEACDDLGGEFCEPEYQKGVCEEKAQA